MSSSQFSEWLAYAAIEPFGEFRDELRHGQMMALHCNINRDSKTKPEPFHPVEFMNFSDAPDNQPATLEEEIDRIDREVFGLGS